MSRDEIVLAVLAAGGVHGYYAPIQIQKLMFLIDREAAVLLGGPWFSFSPRDYGPFDPQVYEVLERLEAAGYLDVEHGERFREYGLTVAGLAQGQKLLAQLPEPIRRYAQRASNWVRSVTFSQLVSAIYQKYPEMKSKTVFRR